MFKNTQSLNTKVIIIAASVGILVAFLVGLMMYISSVKPVQTNVEKALIEEMHIPA